MAQLYKMTLYVCDFEENLSLTEIKECIARQALNGISISCRTHFANEKVGPHIEDDWDLDIDSRDATTEQWERYFQEG